MQIGRLDAAEPFTTMDGSTIREVAGRVSLPTQNQSLAEATIPAGTATDQHFHHTSEEIYFFTAGHGRMRLGDDEADVRAGDTVVIPPGVEHKLWAAADEDLQLLCCCAPAYSNDDTVITEPGAAE
ncbi:MAG: cupin domain-containing protein [Solirubrobacteraceae bacterium]|nr:cupin domain-containing protein [Solirubrobacteraceae bacterium]